MLAEGGNSEVRSQNSYRNRVGVNHGMHGRDGRGRGRESISNYQVVV